MLRSKWLAGFVALLLGAALVTAQQQRPATQPAQGRQTRARLVQPWSQIKDLNDDTKSKIVEIHRKSTEEMAAIRAKERQDIMALLTDGQKKQVNDFEAQAGQRARARRAAPTSRPAGQ